MPSRSISFLGRMALAGAALLAPSAVAAEPEPVVPPVAAPAPAPKTSWTDRVQIGGKIYLNWNMNLSEGADNANAFDLTRAYLFAKVKVADHVKARLTLDDPNREFTVKTADTSTTVSSNSGRFDVVLKHAYLELEDIGTKGFGMKFGMHDLPWIPFEEKIYAYRFLGPLMMDREGYLSSTDLGLGLTYDSPAKWLSVGLALVNGETWQRPEVSAHKDVQLRLTVSPVTSDDGSLRASAFLSYGAYDKGDDSERFRVLGQLAWESKHLVAAVQYAAASDRASALVARQPSLTSVPGVAHMQGLSAYAWLDTGMFDVAEGVRVFARFDMVDPDTGLDDNSHTRETFGAGYRLNENFQFLVDMELTQHDASAGAGDETRLFVHTEVGF